MSVIKIKKLIGNTEFEPQQKVALKIVNGSKVETHGLLKASTCIIEEEISIPFEFQFISHQIDLEGDGILGKYFLQETKLKICYESNMINFKGNNFSFSKLLVKKYEIEENCRVLRTITVQRRSETTMKTPVDCDDKQMEDLIVKCKISQEFS